MAAPAARVGGPRPRRAKDRTGGSGRPRPWPAGFGGGMPAPERPRGRRVWRGFCDGMVAWFPPVRRPSSLGAPRLRGRVVLGESLAPPAEFGAYGRQCPRDPTGAADASRRRTYAQQAVAGASGPAYRSEVTPARGAVWAKAPRWNDATLASSAGPAPPAAKQSIRLDGRRFLHLPGRARLAASRGRGGGGGRRDRRRGRAQDDGKQGEDRLWRA